MNKFTLEAKVGLFFLATVAIFAYAWFYVLDFGKPQGFLVKARFRSVEGLVVGAQVQMVGIKVGTVKDIQLDPETGKALVILQISDAYRNTIPEDSQVYIKTKGLMGDKYVVITPGKPNVRKLKPGDEITHVYEPTDTEKILERAGVITKDLETLTRTARRQVVDEKGAQKVESAIDNAEATFKHLNELLTRNKDKINKTIDNAESSTASLNDLLARNREKLNRTVDDLEKFSASIGKTGDKFDKSAQDLEVLTRDIRAGKGTLGLLTRDETLYRNADSLIRDIRGLANRIQYGPGVVGRLINDPEIYFEARRTIRNMNKTAEDVSEATPVSTLAIVLGSIFR